MKSNLLFFLITLFILIFGNPVYSSEVSSDDINNYTSKISMKFSRTYCNTIKFGISNEGALKFAIGETKKEFLNNKLNKFIDYDLLNKNILFSLNNNCQIEKFPINKLDNLVFK